MKPFTEYALFELGNESDSFFATGSRISLGEDGGFATPLRNKEQIRFSFSVKNSVRMLANSASIYYFNIEDGQWQIPVNARKDLVGPFGNVSYPTDWSNPSGSVSPFKTVGSLFSEDAKGFSAYGNPLASGSSSPYIQSITQHSHINGILNDETNLVEIISFKSNKVSNASVNIMTHDYPKSVQRSSDYTPSKSESFIVGNQYPFLIEKAVIEIPFCFGETWFQDRTATVSGDWRDSRFGSSFIQAATGTYASDRLRNREFFDRGGPALTVALFSQKGYGSGSILDLIASGTITHSDDTLDVDVRDSPADLSTYRRVPAYPRGVIALTALGIESPAAVIKKEGISTFFTGTVKAKLEASVSNGIDLIASINTFWNGTTQGKDAAKSYYANLLTQRYYKIGDSEISTQQLQLIPADIDPYGRGMSGFSPSGGSIFGYEYNTGGFTLSADKYQNPYYVSNVTRRNKLINYIHAYIDNYWTTYSSTPVVYTTSKISFSSNKSSPYLMNPGEKLVLAISKTRPALSGASFVIPDAASANTGTGYITAIYPLTGSVNGHDVQLATGSINITLYGSYVRNNSEYKP